MSALENLRYVSATAWVVPCILCGLSVYRYFFGKKLQGDRQRAAAWFVSCIFLGYAIMWTAFPAPAIPPAQASAWQGLYALSLVAALLLTFAVWSDES